MTPSHRGTSSRWATTGPRPRGRARDLVAAFSAVLVLAAVAVLPAATAAFSGTTANAGSSWSASARFQTGQAAGWGYDADRQTGTNGTHLSVTPVVNATAVADQAKYETISAGYHGCGLRNSGQLWCWGSNLAGQLGTGDGLDRGFHVRVGTDLWLDVSSGTDHTCAVRTDKTLWCWGNNVRGQLGVGDRASRLTPTRVGMDTDWESVEAGASYTCGLRMVDAVRCWGRNDSRQLGLNSAGADRLIPVANESTADWKALALGTTHACGILTSGALLCWGSDTSGQLGLGAGDQSRSTPTTVAGTGYVSVTAGGAHTCGVRNGTGGELVCFGLGTSGQLGAGTSDQQSPAVVSGTWNVVTAGLAHTCATKGTPQGTLWCFGSNDQAQLGQGVTGGPQPVPQQVATSTAWYSPSAGGNSTCALRGSALVWCWGANDSLQIGDGALTSYEPQALRSGDPVSFQSLAAGAQHSCGVRTSGQLWCWGRNVEGQLGSAAAGDKESPTRVGTGSSWTAVAVGALHTCAINRSQALLCTGSNGSGQLGVAGGSRTALVQESTSSRWLSVAAGGDHTCAVRVDDALLCWGANANGQLGIGSTTSTSVPTRVGGTVSYAQVAVGTAHTCAVRTDATAECWGRNTYGEVGKAPAANRTTPQVLGGGAAWASVDAGDQHSCGVRANGDLYCWGLNDRGQLGLSNRANNQAPVLVSAGQWSQAAAGYRHSCGIRGTQVLCWGSNADDALGTDTAGADSLTPRVVPRLDARLVVAGAGSRHTLVTVAPLL